uniref:Uncharacterized protein n=1 Tax=Pavo cristatus TaxID=9049 RepID=A0A8C9EJ16_PAVCR
MLNNLTDCEDGDGGASQGKGQPEVPGCLQWGSGHCHTQRFWYVLHSLTLAYLLVYSRLHSRSGLAGVFGVTLPSQVELRCPTGQILPWL